MQIIWSLNSTSLIKLSSKLSLNLYTSLSVILVSFLLSLTISPSIFLSFLSLISYSVFSSIKSILSIFCSTILVLSLSLSLISFYKSVPRSLISIFLFANIYLLSSLSLNSNSGVFVSAQLVINLKNRGEEIFQEAISSNSTEDLIEVEYQVSFINI